MDISHKVSHIENEQETILLEDWIDDNLSNLSTLYGRCNEMKQGGFFIFDKLTFMEFCELAYRKSTLYTISYEAEENFH